eukprot:111451_1
MKIPSLSFLPAVTFLSSLSHATAQERNTPAIEACTRNDGVKGHYYCLASKKQYAMCENDKRISKVLDVPIGTECVRDPDSFSNVVFDPICYTIRSRRPNLPP